MKEVEDTWAKLSFNVVSYMKGTSNRGFVLAAVDEVMQVLDDNSMNLQSMSASRFVGPFLNSVQLWEKSLSHISEVIEARPRARPRRELPYGSMIDLSDLLYPYSYEL